jgi:hypothetical protein
MLGSLPNRFAALVESVRQARFQPFQLCDFVPDYRELLGDQIPDMRAHLPRVTLDGKQVPDFAERKPKLLRSSDEFQIRHLGRAIQAVPAACSGWMREQTFPFVKANGIDTQAGFSRDLADSKGGRSAHSAN